MVCAQCSDAAPGREHGRHAHFHLCAPRHQLVAQVKHLRLHEHPVELYGNQQAPGS